MKYPKRKKRTQPPEYLDGAPHAREMAEHVRTLTAAEKTERLIADPDLSRAMKRAKAEGRALTSELMPSAQERRDKSSPPGKRARFWAAVREEYLAAALREESLNPGHVLSFNEFARLFRLREPTVRAIGAQQNWKAMARFLITARESDRKLYEATRKELVQRNLLEDSTINDEANVRQRQAHFGRTLQLRGMARLQDVPIGKIPIHIAADLVRLGSQLEREAVGANPKESLASLQARTKQGQFTDMADAIGKQQAVREFASTFVKSLMSTVAPALEEPLPNTDLRPPPRITSYATRKKGLLAVEARKAKRAALKAKAEHGG